MLHAAAWTNVDGAEAEQGAAEDVNVLRDAERRRRAARRSSTSRPTTSSTARRGQPYVESDEPNPLSVYGRTKLAGEREVRDGLDRALVVAVRVDVPQLRPHDAAARRRARRGRGRRRPARLPHLRRAPRVRRSARSLELPHGLYHLAADGDCTWADFAEAIFEEAGLDCRVRRITTAEFGRSRRVRRTRCSAPSGPDTPRLPHWREGLRRMPRPPAARG